jgi:hypothetical protein
MPLVVELSDCDLTTFTNLLVTVSAKRIGFHHFLPESGEKQKIILMIL